MLSVIKLCADENLLSCPAVTRIIFGDMACSLTHFAEPGRGFLISTLIPSFVCVNILCCEQEVNISMDNNTIYRREVIRNVMRAVVMVFNRLILFCAVTLWFKNENVTGSKIYSTQQKKGSQMFFKGVVNVNQRGSFDNNWGSKC